MQSVPITTNVVSSIPAQAMYLMRMSVYIVVWKSSVDENDTVFHKPQSRVCTHNNDQSEPTCHVTAMLWAYCISRRIDTIMR